MNEVNSFLRHLEQKLIDFQADLSDLTGSEQYELIARRAVHVIEPDLLRKRLEESRRNNRPLVVKYGIDPTAKDLHLGHIVPIIVARRLQLMGHKIVLVFGDFTALVGDPTGRVKTRPILTSEAIKKNVAEFSAQVAKFIDLSKVKIVFNSAFYEQLTIKELMQLYRKHKVAPLLQRDDFRNRIGGLTIAEMLYPTLMAIDSLMIKPDIELGGNDQFLNFQITNEVLKSEGVEPECAVTTELLLGTSGTGAKMSKSEGNFISLRDTAEDVFGKIMSIPDELLEHYFLLLTDISDDEWARIHGWVAHGDLNPMVVKKLLARVLVTMTHSQELAEEECAKFEKTFSRGVLPDDVPEFVIQHRPDAQPWVELLVITGLASSKREAREHIKNGALSILLGETWEKITDIESSLPDDPLLTIKLGKRQFARFKIHN